MEALDFFDAEASIRNISHSNDPGHGLKLELLRDSAKLWRFHSPVSILAIARGHPAANDNHRLIVSQVPDEDTFLR